jgi:(1->4)-alpha-D-glucan 1-alpha-D-glucosylmutase
VADARAQLEQAAARCGIAPWYDDIQGHRRTVPDAALRALLEEFDDAPPARAAPPPAPGPCWQALAPGERVWGPSVQLYSLRSSRNWGIGDFGDLAVLLEWAAARGAALVGLNPLHALFAHEPAHCSPYSPSTRLFWNALYLAVDQVPEFAECAAARARADSAEFRSRLARLRAAPLVDYAGVASAKSEILLLVYAHFRERHLAHDTARARAFARFRRERGADLDWHTAWEALVDGAGDPAYYAYLQWLADAQLGAAQARAKAHGMAIGLYLDLAVSVDRGGSEVAGHASLFARGASIGAPPDAFNPDGQDWGLPPPRPDRMRASGYARLRAALAANMRHAGAIRVDHVMQLQRLFWIPPGFPAREGAYVHYPLDELVAVLAEESRRHHCMVVGEDLGTVAPEVRAAMRGAGMLGMQLLRFERDAAGAFRPPQAYAPTALAALGTHDMPTLAGWLGDAAQAADRRALADALGAPPDAENVHAFLAATPCPILLLQPEDALGVAEPWNVPGTTAEHPNWRRKLPLAVEDFGASERLERVVRAIRSRR